MNIIDTLTGFKRMIGHNSNEKTAELLNLSKDALEVALNSPDRYTVARKPNNQYVLLAYTEVSNAELTGASERTSKKRNS